MTTPYLPADIAAEEGLKLVGYLDSAHVPTVGYGHTGAGVTVGMKITKDQADQWLAQDIHSAVQGLTVALPWWRTLDDARQDVLVQMAFQLGINGLLQFKDTLSAMSRGDYARAADCMLKSKWAKQDSPDRARRESMQMRSGVRAWARATPPATIKAEPETDV